MNRILISKLFVVFLSTVFTLGCAQNKAKDVAKDYAGENYTVVTTSEPENENQAVVSQKKVTSPYFHLLFPKKELLRLPTSATEISKLLRTDAKELDCDACENGKNASWDFDGFNMIYYRLTSGEEAYAIQYYGNDAVAGLPHDLVFNESTAEECYYKLKKYNARLYRTTVEVDAMTSQAVSVVSFKVNGMFVNLEFGNGFLSRMVVSNKQI